MPNKTTTLLVMELIGASFSVKKKHEVEMSVFNLSGKNSKPHKEYFNL
jgi:hypothetical protein